jgi:branched-chain amino acid transport system substrate-binding protein
MQNYIVAALVIGFLSVLAVSSSVDKAVPPETLTIGAVLPLTGPAAIWGESIRNGMLLAEQELEKNGASVEIVFEDTQGQPSVAVTGYRSLVDVHHVDLVVSALSKTTMPLVPLAEESKVPLVMTVVSANGATEGSTHAFRFYNTATQYVTPYFKTSLTEQTYPTLAVIYINDEFGVSVRDAVRAEALQAGVRITHEEYFVSGTSDFRTHLATVKALRPDAVLFVAVAPAEATALVRQARELGITVPLFDGASALSNAGVRADLGPAAENTFVTVYPIALGKTGQGFTETYSRTYGTAPHFAASLGYDIVKVAVEAEQRSGTKRIADSLRALTRIDTENGTFTVDGSTREMNPTLYVAKVVDGVLVEVK